MTSHLIIGAGEVGRGLATVTGWNLVDVHNAEDFSDPYDILHICFPFGEHGEDFVEEVRRYAVLHQALIVVVHSTVPVGTCDPMGMIHAPIRGRHPNLAEGIEAFTLPLGGEDSNDLEVVQSEFSAVGITSRIYPNARTTELGKLLELAQYGVEIRMQKEAYWLAREHGVDPDEAYRLFGRHYNEGYRALGVPDFVKPILREVPGPVGGHCVAQNTPMLGENFFTWAVAPISREGWDGRLT